MPGSKPLKYTLSYFFASFFRGQINSRWKRALCSKRGKNAKKLYSIFIFTRFNRYSISCPVYIHRFYLITFAYRIFSYSMETFLFLIRKSKGHSKYINVRKLFKGRNYMRKYGTFSCTSQQHQNFVYLSVSTLINFQNLKRFRLRSKLR